VSERPVPAYLTPGQAARILHVSPRTVDRWADQGRVPCIVTLGGHRRFSREVILAVAAEMEGRGNLPGEE
jgi:excisionase family DNA binding protein